MLNFSDQHTPVSSPDEYPVLTSSELSRLQYLFLSHNLERIRQDLLRHQQERESIFNVLSHSAPFQDIITPIVLNFRYRQRQVSPANPPSPALHISSDSSVPEQEPKQRTIIIQEQSNSDSSLLLYYTTAHEELGTRHNPIDVNRLLDPSPSPPQTPIYSPPRTKSAPITTPCSLWELVQRTVHQTVWQTIQQTQ